MEAATKTSKEIPLNCSNYYTILFNLLKLKCFSVKIKVYYRKIAIFVSFLIGGYIGVQIMMRKIVVSFIESK